MKNGKAETRVEHANVLIQYHRPHVQWADRLFKSCKISGDLAPVNLSTPDFQAVHPSSTNGSGYHKQDGGGVANGLGCVEVGPRGAHASRACSPYGRIGCWARLLAEKPYLIHSGAGQGTGWKTDGLHGSVSVVTSMPRGGNGSFEHAVDSRSASDPFINR